MWKRRNINPKDRHNFIGSPTLISTDVNQDVLSNAKHIDINVPSILAPPERPIYGPRKSTGDASKALPRLPRDSMQQSMQRRPMSEVPTTSSTCSGPSPEFDGYPSFTSRSPPRSSSLYPADVSPPDTPIVASECKKGNRASSEVSPISATPSPTASHSPVMNSSGSRRYSSNLPLPKSTTKKFWKLPNAAKGSEDSDSSTVKWDEYSGEPTAGDRGKPSSATPGSIKLKETPGPLRLRPNYGTSTMISSSHAPARKRVGTRELAEAPIVLRPEWKGAGGRHSIVKPVFDKPVQPGQSRKFPVGSHKQLLEEQECERLRLERAEREQEEKENECVEQERIEKEQEATELAKQLRERAAQEQREREREQQQRMARVRIEKAKRERERIVHGYEESERRAQGKVERVPPPALPEPLRVVSNTASPSHTQPISDMPGIKSQASMATNHLDLLPPETSYMASTPESASSAMHNPKMRVGSLINNDMSSPLARNPSTEEMRERRNQSLPSLPQSEQSSPAASSMADQPFPTVRHDNSQEHTSSLRDPNQIEARFRSNLQHMSLEEQPQSRFSATTVATTAYDNSPPQTPEMPSNLVTPTTTPNSILNRKRPVAPSGVIRRKPTPSQSGIPNGVTKIDSKSLPKPPPDAEVIDPIQALQAKVDVLRRRRRNLETVIHELTNVVQPSSIAYDRASRAEIKKTVAGLDKELSEVIKDEHETGLKLHRAWKRHEDFAAYEPTSIWVRRVTN